MHAQRLSVFVDKKNATAHGNDARVSSEEPRLPVNAGGERHIITVHARDQRARGHAHSEIEELHNSAVTVSDHATHTAEARGQSDDALTRTVRRTIVQDDYFLRRLALKKHALHRELHVSHAVENRDDHRNRR